jgi:2-oxoglutarate dehydrogenase E2 component (dihydrolipoamide succinyltransferase)
MPKISLVRDHRAKIIRLEPWRRVVADGFDLAPKPDFCGVWLQDLLAATLFRDRYRHERKVPLTYLPILIRACALTLKKYPIFSATCTKNKIIIPSSIDIGVSVNGREVLAPVVVIREADTKSLQETVRELQEKLRQVKEQQQQELRILNWIGTWVPSVIRRKLVAWALRNPTLRRTYVGTFQISVLNYFPGFAIGGFLPTAFMMFMSDVAKRPIIVDERLEVRPTAYLTLAGDHRIAAGKHILDWLCQLSHHETEIRDSDRAGLDYAAAIMPIN